MPLADPRQARHVFLDFDSTLVASEGLEVLADVVGESLLPGEATKLRRQVEMLTELAMAGQVRFGQALQRRVRLLAPRRDQLDEAARRIGETILDDAASTIAALRKAGKEVFVLSGGVAPLVLPGCEAIGVDRSRVHCNHLVFENERCTGVDADRPLAQDGGKAKVVASIAASADAVMVGDGATDLEVRTLGACGFFACFVGVRRRRPVAEAADALVERLSDLTELLT